MTALLFRLAARTGVWAASVLAVLGSVALTQGTLAGAGERYTPVVQSVPSPPRWFLGTDGQVHLVYELLLTNAFPVPVTVTSVEVLGTAPSRPLARFSGDRLSAAMSLLATGSVPTTTLPPSGVGAAWLDVPLPTPQALPGEVLHRVTVSVPPGLPVPTTITDTGGAARVDLRPPTVLGPPLLGSGWAAIGSCCDGPHRRAIQPINGRLHLSQRFAIDFNRLGEASRIVVGDPYLNVSYPTYAQPVLAVADATVLEAVDRYPDQVPNHPRPVGIEEADGNHVILDLGGGRFAFYAHLKPGSVGVRAGQTVRRGQMIAQVGNSGSSSGPHLHFQVMDRPSALAADGLPYVFDCYEISGRTPPLDVLLQSDPRTPVPVDPQTAGPQRASLPLGRDVLTFPPVPTPSRSCP
ncbi:M23 family metallopeptidase (plasmid) [Deinococcus metallilatus]|uniref:Murein DD-endopeptidase MepM/ murein hydrolase activator NlpD n=1 Tax=Deinococcus metallilatus TaxID=1211322 RepID=A0ABR6MNN7_9DEIO|nr:M23 family metallopeptidase [Deinococcus metallilatus]MBB5293551.1 murein DD-endopeptidase MepM/ murein hydrolase activator NlpD [Deinococcus metallilatus]QBY06623.1 M23 family metallopeptidase [Deinococcus metallilatus]RXJ17966.1 M23 family metallopeptidase [Deinococcus metallilatus]GMA15228.1 peptidase M23 [Deinococcus metallilatus]